MSLESAAADAGYTLVNLAARGMRGSIYRADDAAGERVAMKVFDAGVSADDLEARVASLAPVRHDALLGFRRVLQLDGEAAVISEWFDGAPLADALAGPDPMPEIRAERIAGRILDGLAALHRAGLAHGAVSERNILIDGDSPLLVDFALGEAGAPTPADDVRAMAPVLRSLFARTDLPAWRIAAFDRADSGSGFADAAELKSAVLPSRRQRVRLEREENDEKPPVLLMVVVGLGAVMITIGAFLFFSPDEEPLPEPTITGVESDDGS